MEEMSLAPEVLSYYRKGGEADRLTSGGGGKLEFLRTQDVLRRVLPSAGLSVLDVGGGHGIHAEWLAADGHRVHVIEPVPDHVEAASRLPEVTAQLGDARDLPVGDKEYDVVLMLGPLYHLQSRAERLAALGEARRVVKPGGLVVAATINRFAGWHDLLSKHALTDDGALTAMLDREYETGEHQPGGMELFTTAYFHRPDQISEEFDAAGLTDHVRYIVEGVAWLVSDVESDLDNPVTREIILNGLRRMETEPSLMGASGHLLTVAVSS